MEIQKVELDLIKPYWRNPRQTDSAVAVVKASIEKYGYNVPIVVDTDYVILAGHVRYRALRELGYDKANVVVADLPEDKARQFRIADNKTGEMAEWDMEMLKKELAEFEATEDISEFFSDAEWRALVDLPPETPDMDDSGVGERKTEDKDNPLPDAIEVECPYCLATNIVKKVDLLQDESFEDSGKEEQEGS